MSILVPALVKAQLTIRSDATWKSSIVWDDQAKLACFDDSGWVNASSPSPYCLPSFLPPVPSTVDMWHPGSVETAFFRKTFELNHDVSSAVAYISIDNEFELFVNGSYVGTGTIGSIHSFNIAPLLRCGQNVIGIHGTEWILGTPSCIMFGCTIDTIPGTFTECDDEYEYISICEGDSILIDGTYYSDPGVYTTILPDDQLCSVSTILDISYEDLVVVQDSATICLGDSLLFGGGYISEAGLYTTLVDATPCAYLLELELDVITDILVLQDSATICLGDSLMFGGGYISEAGLYTTLVDATPCAYILELELDVITDILVLQDSASICQGDSILFGEDYISEAGLYSIEVEASPCPYLIEMELDVIPLVVVQDSASICQGDSILFGEDYISVAGLYTIEVEDIPCPYLIEMELDVIAQLVEQDSATICEGDSLLFGGDYIREPGFYTTIVEASPCPNFIELELDVVSQIDTMSFRPCPGRPFGDSGYIVYQDTVLTELFIDTESGCETLRIITVDVDRSENCFQIFVPNAFSPNGDGINDQFGIFFPEGFTPLELNIFNRWGNLVHRSFIGDSFRWDGVYQGIDQELGVYVWYLIYKDYWGNARTLRGNLTLVR